MVHGLHRSDCRRALMTRLLLGCNMVVVKDAVHNFTTYVLDMQNCIWAIHALSKTANGYGFPLAFHMQIATSDLGKLAIYELYGTTANS